MTLTGNALLRESKDNNKELPTDCERNLKAKATGSLRRKGHRGLKKRKDDKSKEEEGTTYEQRLYKLIN